MPAPRSIFWIGCIVPFWNNLANIWNSSSAIQDGFRFGSTTTVGSPSTTSVVKNSKPYLPNLGESPFSAKVICLDNFTASAEALIRPVVPLVIPVIEERIG